MASTYFFKLAHFFPRYIFLCLTNAIFLTWNILSLGHCLQYLSSSKFSPSTKTYFSIHYLSEGWLGDSHFLNKPCIFHQAGLTLPGTVAHHILPVPNQAMSYLRLILVTPASNKLP